MPRLMSPMIRRRPLPPLRDEEPLRGQEASRGQEPSQAPELRRAPEPPAPEQEPPAFEEPEESARIATGTYRQIRDYSLVLLSQGIVHRFLRSEEGPFEIFVVPEVEARAREQLELYSRENPPLPLSLSIQPAWVLLVPVVCTILDFGNFVDRMHFAGLSDASKVLHGEWWRTITALTLHGDARHIASNLVSGYIVLNLMSYRIPLARMAPFLAVASAVANFFVAFTVQSDYRALGFSTFVFAAIGSLAVIEFRLMPKETHGMLRRFAPLCGAASLAVFLGLGENADILGHAYGFIAGAICGLIPQKKTLRWGTPTTLADLVWVAIYFAIFIVGWKFALA